LAPLWWAALAVAGVAVVPGRPWQGPLAVALAAAVVVGLSAHTRRRFGGVTGDVLGAANELAVTAALAVVAAG
jgi:adenosylcobinamide-GDP ribazoletransferase